MNKHQTADETRKTNPNCDIQDLGLRRAAKSRFSVFNLQHETASLCTGVGFLPSRSDLLPCSIAAGRWSIHARDGSLRMFSGGADRLTLTSARIEVNGILVSNSDRTTKENVRSVDARAVLEKVAALPISTWNLKADQVDRRSP